MHSYLAILWKNKNWINTDSINPILSERIDWIWYAIRVPLILFSSFSLWQLWLYQIIKLSQIRIGMRKKRILWRVMEGVLTTKTQNPPKPQITQQKSHITHQKFKIVTFIENLKKNQTKNTITPSKNAIQKSQILSHNQLPTLQNTNKIHKNHSSTLRY